jgi:hypothetical protein
MNFQPETSHRYTAMTQVSRNPDGVVSIGGEPRAFRTVTEGMEELRRAEAASPWLQGVYHSGSAAAARAANRPDPPRPDPAASRAKLAEALEARKRAVADHVQADTVAKRARDLETEAEAELNRLQSVDDEVAAHHASMIKEGVAFALLPAESQEKVERNAVLERQLADLRRARARLDDEVRAAFQRLLDSAAWVASQVAAVVACEVEEIVAEVTELKAKITTLNAKLAGCVTLHLGVPIPLSPRAKAVLADMPVRPATNQWRALTEALKGGDVKAKLDTE